MRRKAGTLVPLEIAICAAAARLKRRGESEFYGYEMAKRIAEDAEARLLTAYGTLYRALTRLESMGFLESRWEDPHIAARENRPGRRLYRLTGAGEEALEATRQGIAATRGKPARRRLAPA
jgi:DNA-binding PadR family transcriptional regulator